MPSRRKSPSADPAQPQLQAGEATRAVGSPHAPSRALLAGLIAGVAVLTLAAHLPGLSANALCMDDSDFLTENHLVQNPSWDSVSRFFGEVLRPSTVQGYYLPLSMTSLMLDYAAGGRPDHLEPFHRTSLLLHVLNTCLILWLLYALFGEPWSAAAIALLFGVHPLTVEPVAWVGERKTLLAACFALLALILYVRHARHDSWPARIGAVAMYVLAILSKPTAWPLWLVLIVMDYWPLRRFNRRTLLAKWPFVAVACISAVITLLSHRETAGIRSPGSPVEQLLQAGYLLSFYAGKMVWPASLTPIYLLPEPMSLFNPSVLGGVAVTVALAAALIGSTRRTRALLAGGAVFLVLIAPTLGMVRYSWVTASDKYVYLPAVGLLLPAAMIVGRRLLGAHVPRQTRLATLAVVVLLVIAQTRMTWNYLVKWQNSETLARHVVHLAPESAAANNLLASALSRAGKHDEALVLARRVVELDPEFVEAHYNLALLLARTGRSDEAIRAYQRDLLRSPHSAKTHNNLANLLARQGDYDEALQHYARVLELRPGSPEVHYNLGMALLALDRPAEAVHRFQEASRLAPGRAQVHTNLGTALRRTGQFDEAIAAFRHALSLQPRNTRAHLGLADALTARGEASAALPHYQEAARLEPSNPETWHQLAAALERTGDTPAAVAAYRRLLQIDPQHESARSSLERLHATNP